MEVGKGSPSISAKVAKAVMKFEFILPTDWLQKYS
jgi:hypothetical protein